MLFISLSFYSVGSPLFALFISLSMNQRNPWHWSCPLCPMFCIALILSFTISLSSIAAHTLGDFAKTWSLRHPIELIETAFDSIDCISSIAPCPNFNGMRPATVTPIRSCLKVSKITQICPKSLIKATVTPYHPISLFLANLKPNTHMRLFEQNSLNAPYSWTQRTFR